MLIAVSSDAQSVQHDDGKQRTVGELDRREVVRRLVPETPTAELHARTFLQAADADDGDVLVPSLRQSPDIVHDATRQHLAQLLAGCRLVRYVDENLGQYVFHQLLDGATGVESGRRVDAGRLERAADRFRASWKR